jgi:hypothetical protein
MTVGNLNLFGKSQTVLLRDSNRDRRLLEWPKLNDDSSNSFAEVGNGGIP